MPNVALHDVDSKPSDYPKGEAVAVSVLPNCDICRYVHKREEDDIRRALFDGKTSAGPWANMCLDDFNEHGIALGTGWGQRLVIPGLGESIMRHPAGKGLKSETSIERAL